MSSTSIRGADIVMRTLERAGHNTIFTLSGNHIMSLFDAAIDTRHRLIHTRHEAAAVHMADAWGRLTGEPGLAMVTGGPGHANAAAALMTALGQESPLVLLSGHTETTQLGRGGFQELRQADMAANGQGFVDGDGDRHAGRGSGQGNPDRTLWPTRSGTSEPAIGPARRECGGRSCRVAGAERIHRVARGSERPGG
jgi:hypothetical protein